MHHVGLIIAIQHGLGNGNQTAGQREGADNACQHRTVFDQLQRFFDGLDVKTGTTSADLGNGQRLSLRQAFVLVHLGGDHRANTGRHLVVGHMDGSAETLGLN